MGDEGKATLQKAKRASVRKLRQEQAHQALAYAPSASDSSTRDSRPAKLSKIKVKLDLAKNKEHKKTLIEVHKQILEKEWEDVPASRKAAFVPHGRCQRPLEGDVLISVNGVDVRRLEAFLYVPLELCDVELEDLIASFYKDPEHTFPALDASGKEDGVKVMRLPYRGPDRRKTMSAVELEKWR